MRCCKHHRTQQACSLMDLGFFGQMNEIGANNTRHNIRNIVNFVFCYLSFSRRTSFLTLCLLFVECCLLSVSLFAAISLIISTHSIDYNLLNFSSKGINILIFCSIFPFSESRKKFRQLYVITVRKCLPVIAHMDTRYGGCYCVMILSSGSSPSCFTRWRIFFSFPKKQQNLLACKKSWEKFSSPRLRDVE